MLKRVLEKAEQFRMGKTQAWDDGEQFMDFEEFMKEFDLD
tara:strand:+ start:1637 stop:1756 length:120 start_codon:yes stop_codon:yes gene_type:complete